MHLEFQRFALIGVLLLTSCRQPGARNTEKAERQETIAKEIVSIESSFCVDLVQLNNANAVDFVAKVESLAGRLDEISKELDTLGPFPKALRADTLKKLEDADKIFAKKNQSRTSSFPLEPKAAKTIEPSGTRCFSAMAPVMMKAGLYFDAAGGVPDIDTDGQGTNHP
jgi:hypothetical protein